jgi:hypothetical protein
VPVSPKASRLCAASLYKIRAITPFPGKKFRNVKNRVQQKGTDSEESAPLFPPLSAPQHAKNANSASYRIITILRTRTKSPASIRTQESQEIT